MKEGLAVFLVLLFARPVWAAEQIKIGFVDIQKAINESQAGKKAKEKFQVQVKKVEAELLKEKQDVERLKSDFEKKSPLLKEEEKRNLERELQKKERGYLLSGREAEEELRQRDSEITGEILRDILKIVAEIGKSERYTLILQRGQVPYGDDASDITKKVIEIYNSRGSGKVPSK